MTNDNLPLVPKIIFENDDVVVIDKPAGMLVHENLAAGTEGTVTEWFLKSVPEARGVGEKSLLPDGRELERSGVVHRLDKETSGVLVLVKNQSAYDFIKMQFKNRTVKKEYRAFVYGRINERYGTIDRPIGRKVGDPKRRSAEGGAKGTLREALTYYECIGVGEYKGESFSYVKLLPETGRTHQLRVHLRAIDRPIVGDALYAEHKINTSNNLELDQLALHAHILDLELAVGERSRFIAPLPTIFERAAERIAE